MPFEAGGPNILEAYSRFVVALQNKLIDGDFVMTRELFLEMAEKAGKGK